MGFDDVTPLDRINCSEERQALQELQELVKHPLLDLSGDVELVRKLKEEPWEVKDEIFGITTTPSGHVTVLIMHRLDLTRIPETISSFTHLKELYLESNQLTSLPESFGNLTTLQVLDLSWNQLSSLPESFGNLVNLQHLSMPNNQVSLLPETFGNLINLQTLDLGGNRLSMLPDNFGNLVNLKELYLWDDQLSSLPESFGNLVNLQVLILQRNQLSSLPESFGNLVNLQVLDLVGNQLSTLPQSFGNLANLQVLLLHENQLSSLPENFGNLANLKELYLRWNRLTSLPESFGSLSNLQLLVLQDNQLSSLPESFDALTQLQELHLGNNPLKYVNITGFLDSGTLQEFTVDDGVMLIAKKSTRPPSVETLPAGLRDKEIQWFGIEELESFKRDWTEIWRIKVILVGEMEMGKTALARALTREAVLHRDATVIIEGRELSAKDLEDHDAEKQSFLKRILKPPLRADRTVGIDRWILRIPHERTFSDREDYWEIVFWDFAGHQVYRSAHQPFLTKEGVYLVVFHPRSDQFHQLQLARWHQRIRSVSDSAPILYVKTRSNEPAFTQQWQRIKKSFLEWLKNTGQLGLEINLNDESNELGNMFIEVDSDENKPLGITKLLTKLETLATTRYPPRRVIRWQHQVEQVILQWQAEVMRRNELGIKTVEEVAREVHRRLSAMPEISRLSQGSRALLRQILWKLHDEGVVLWIDLSGRPWLLVLNVDLMCKAVTGVEILALKENGRLGVTAIPSLAAKTDSKELGGKVVHDILLDDAKVRDVVTFGVTTGVFYWARDDVVMVPSALPTWEEIHQDEPWQRWTTEFLELTKKTLLLEEGEFVEKILQFEMRQHHENLLTEILSYLRPLELVVAWRNGALLSLKAEKGSDAGSGDGAHEETWISFWMTRDDSSMVSKNGIPRGIRGKRAPIAVDRGLTTKQVLSIVTRGKHVAEVSRQLHVMILVACAALKLEPMVTVSYQCSACGWHISRKKVDSRVKKGRMLMDCPNCDEELSLVQAMMQDDSSSTEELPTSLHYWDLQSFQSMLKQQSWFFGEILWQVQQVNRTLGKVHEDLQERMQDINGTVRKISRDVEDLGNELEIIRREFKHYHDMMLKQLGEIDQQLSKEFNAFFNRIQLELAETRDDVRGLVSEGKISEDELVARITNELGSAIETWFRDHWWSLENRLSRLTRDQALVVRGIMKLLTLHRWDDLPPIVDVSFQKKRLKNVVRAWFGCNRCGKKAPSFVMLDEWRHWVRVTKSMGKAGILTVYCLINPTSDVIKAGLDVYEQLKSKEELPAIAENALAENLDFAGYEKLRRTFLGTTEVFQWFRYEPEHGWTCHDH